MKRTAWLLIGMFLLPALVRAEGKIRVEVNQRGEVRTVVVSKNMDTWHSSPAEQEAYDHPGKEVSKGSYQVRYKRVSFFYYRLIKEYKEVFVFQDNLMHTIKKAKEVAGKQVFAVNVVFLLIAILLMAIGNVAYWRNKKDDPVFAAAALAVVAALFAAVAAIAVFAVALFAAVVFTTTCTAVFVATLVAAAIAKNDSTGYWIYSVLFYIFAGIAIYPW